MLAEPALGQAGGRSIGRLPFQGHPLRGAVAGAPVVAPVDFAVLQEEGGGVFLDVAFQLVQREGGTADTEVFVDRFGCTDRDLDVPLLVPQQVGPVNPPLRPQRARGVLEIGPARRQHLDVEQHGAAGHDPDLAPPLELVIPSERPLSEAVVLFSVVLVDRAVAVDHLPQLLDGGTGDRISIIAPLHRWRSRGMSRRQQGNQNG